MSLSEKSRVRQPGARQDGAELVEFALVLPLLLVLLLGIFDFGSAFLLRQEMTNAARECARIMVSSPLTDQSCQSSTPCAVIGAADSVVHYMAAVGASVSCIQPASPTTSETLEWTYSCANGTSLAINRGFAFASPGGVWIPATRVTLTYPIHWELTQFLPGFTGFTRITTQATMQNLVPD